MANAFTRGSAPGRAREDWERKGSLRPKSRPVWARRQPSQTWQFLSRINQRRLLSWRSSVHFC
jgi:hypothetical protein